jgi:hypothetical protein
MDRKNEILLEEKVAQIDDINFDKIYDTSEIATQELENFDTEVPISDNFSQISNLHDNSSDIFSMEIGENEGLNTLGWEQKSVKVKQRKSLKEKFDFCNKPLIIACTSIAVLLCILFIYNLFVLNSLKSTWASSVKVNGNYQVSTVAENNVISFENGNTLEIENKLSVSNGEYNLTSNLFDEFCSIFTE